MSHTYSHLYGIPTTGLRFFTVYGPWGRPDMALFKFAKLITEGKPIDVYNNGSLSRDFTYIDDIVEGIIRIQDVIPQKDENWTVESGSPEQSSAPYKVYNIGNGSPVKLENFIDSLENALNIKAQKNYMPMQPGDVYKTYADVDNLFEITGFKPNTSIEAGVTKFVDWYQAFYKA